MVFVRMRFNARASRRGAARAAPTPTLPPAAREQLTRKACGHGPFGEGTGDGDAPSMRDDEPRERTGPRHRRGPGGGGLARFPVGVPAGRLPPQPPPRPPPAGPRPLPGLRPPAVLL